ncbi:hypothetical protein QF006_004454 [Pantoea agglomerans]|nr:hypothetical protein [Pantoea agglomerans]
MLTQLLSCAIIVVLFALWARFLKRLSSYSS